MSGGRSPWPAAPRWRRRASPRRSSRTSRSTRAAGGARQIVVGWRFACGLLGDGRAACWGDHDTREVPDGTFVALSAGERHVCGLRPDRHAVCWGWGEYGQLNAPGDEFVNLLGGCTLDAAGALRCTRGRSSIPIDSPVPASRGPFKELSMRGDHGRALARSGELACWGPDRFGEVSPPAGPFKTVALGDAHGCAIREDGALACWGSYAGAPL